MLHEDAVDDDEFYPAQSEDACDEEWNEPTETTFEREGARASWPTGAI